MFCKITEYLVWIVGLLLLSGMFLGWVISGEILKSIFGVVALLILASGTFVFTIREILYWASSSNYRKKDDQ